MQKLSLPRGAVMADIAATSLSATEKKRLAHPALGGVILFRRNYTSPAQLRALCAEIKAVRQPELIIAVDHEGGRVQRFQAGFTRLPAMAQLGRLADEKGTAAALAAAREVGQVLAAELRACGVDLSFTPVLDLDYGACAVIGNRSFHRDARIVAQLAAALQDGLRAGGMASCGKHFPGHGFVSGDSHCILPEDPRNLAQMAEDLHPFSAMVAAGMAAVMPAHVLYRAADNAPAGFSAFWLQKILRTKMDFDGMIFSDDLTMEGAGGAGGIRERAAAAFQAGCDVVLVCNRPDWADALLADFRPPENARLAARWAQVAGQGLPEDFARQIQTADFAAMAQRVAALCAEDDSGAPKVGE